MTQEDKVLDFIKVIPILGDLFRERYTGALRLDSEKGTRVFYLKEGNLISIGTTVNEEKLDEILIKEGKLTREHIKEALEKSNSFAQIGKQLTAFGFITFQDLEDSLKKQANLVLGNVIKEGKGKISFMEGHEPTRTDIFFYETHLWLYDFINGIEDRGLIFELLPPLNHFIGKEMGLEEFLELLPWDNEDKELASKLNGTFTVAECTSYSKKREMDIYKKLAFLHSFGVIKSFGESPKKLVQPPLFNPLEIEKETLPPDSGVGLPLPPTHASRKRKIFYVYPIVGSLLVILILGGIFVYHAFLSKPPKIEPPIIKVEEKVPEPIKEEEDTMVLSKSKIEKEKEEISDIKEGKTLQEIKAEKPPEKIEKKAEKQPERIEKPVEKQPEKPLEKVSEKKEKPLEKVSEKKEEIALPSGSKIYNEGISFLEKAKTYSEKSYTLQLLIACQEETILKLREKNPSYNFWFIPINFKGKVCFKVFYGNFGSKEEAEGERNNLPEEILKGKPQTMGIALKDSIK